MGWRVIRPGVSALPTLPAGVRCAPGYQELPAPSPASRAGRSIAEQSIVQQRLVASGRAAWLDQGEPATAPLQRDLERALARVRSRLKAAL